MCAHGHVSCLCADIYLLIPIVPDFAMNIQVATASLYKQLCWLIAGPQNNSVSEEPFDLKDKKIKS